MQDNAFRLMSQAVTLGIAGFRLDGRSLLVSRCQDRQSNLKAKGRGSSLRNALPNGTGQYTAN